MEAWRDEMGSDLLQLQQLLPCVYQPPVQVSLYGNFGNFLKLQKRGKSLKLSPNNVIVYLNNFETIYRSEKFIIVTGLSNISTKRQFIKYVMAVGLCP